MIALLACYIYRFGPWCSVIDNNVFRFYAFECIVKIMFYFIFRTIKQDCKACLKLSLSGDKQLLVITDVNEQRNHAVSDVSEY